MRSRWRSGLEVAPWLLVSLFAHAALFSQVARRMSIEPLEEPALPRPPEALELPLFPTPTSAAIVALLVLLPAATVWMQRRWERRMEPLALGALSLACLGHLAAIGGALAVAEHGDRAYPVNLVTLGIGLCVGAAVVGVAAVARILFDRARRSGLALAIACAGCSLFAAWVTHRFFDVERFPRIEPGLPALPVALHSWPDRWSPAVDGERWTLEVLADGGVRSAERSLPAGASDGELVALLSRIAAEMPKDNGVPCGPLRLRIDRAVGVARVEALLWACLHPEVEIFKLQLATRWPSPPRATRIHCALPAFIGTHQWDRAPLEGERHVLRVSSGQSYELNGRALAGARGLEEALADIGREARDLPIEILPTGEPTWGALVTALDAARTFPFEFWLGRVPFGIY